MRRLQRLDASAYSRMTALLHRSADRDPDGADIALVWLAEATGITRIVMLDVADFSVYRSHGRKRFELEPLRQDEARALFGNLDQAKTSEDFVAATA